EREVGERGEFAARADRALRGDDGMDPEVEEGQQPVDQERPAAAVAQGQRISAQEEHAPDALPVQWLPDTGRMAHEEVLLEARRVRRRDESVRQVAEPG